MAILILVALGLITVNLILVNCETYIMMAAGLILLAFGATEWTRDMSVSYYRHLLAVGLKQFVTLLLAGIALNILQSIIVSPAPAAGEPIYNSVGQRSPRQGEDFGLLISLGKVSNVVNPWSLANVPLPSRDLFPLGVPPTDAAA